MVRSTQVAERYLGVIADGPTDREVLAKLVRCTVGGTGESDGPNRFSDIVLLQRQTIRHHVDKLWDEASRSDDYRIVSGHARTFIGKVVAVLHGSIDEFKNEVGRDIEGQDLLIINTDSERVLRSKDTYLEEEWGGSLSRLLWAAVEKYYHIRASHSHLIGALPLILPLPVFPSTEMLVAAAGASPYGAFTYHGKKPHELKRMLYGQDFGFGQLALDSITPESIESIYAHIPEARLFLRILFWSRFGWP